MANTFICAMEEKLERENKSPDRNPCNVSTQLLSASGYVKYRPNFSAVHDIKGACYIYPFWFTQAEVHVMFPR